MSDLGFLLKGHREERGLTIEDISDASKINSRHLRAIEAGDWSGLPEPVYTRAFIRHFAVHVGVDPDMAVSLYESEVGLDLKSAALTSEAAPTPEAAPGRKRRRKRSRWKFPGNLRLQLPATWQRAVSKNSALIQGAVLILFLVVIGITIIGIRSWFSPEEVIEVPHEPFVHPEPDITRTLALLTPEDLLMERRSHLATSGDEVQHEIVSESDTLSAWSGDEHEDVELLTDIDPVGNIAAPSSVTLTVEVQEDCWFEVTSDGERIFVGVLTAGTVVDWAADELLRVTFGRPEGVYLTLNGQYIGVAGSGVITREFTPHN